MDIVDVVIEIVNWIFLYVEGWIGQEETLWICNKNSCPHKKGKSSHSPKDRWFCLFLCIIDLKHLILSWFFVIYLFFKFFYLFSEYSMISQVSLSLSLFVCLLFSLIITLISNPFHFLIWSFSGNDYFQLLNWNHVARYFRERLTLHLLNDFLLVFFYAIDGKKGGHTATPHPSKKAGKTPANSGEQSKPQTPKSAGGSFPCKSCSKYVFLHHWKPLLSF